MAPETHEEKTERLDAEVQEMRKHLYGNGDVGLFETVRGIARVQRWQTVALVILLLLQLEQPVREFAVALLRQMVTP